MKIIVSNVHFLGNQVHFVESNRDKPAYCMASSCFYVINCVLCGFKLFISCYVYLCDQWLSMVIPINIWGHSGSSDKEEAPQGFTNIIIYVNFIAIIIKQSKWLIWQSPLKSLNFTSKRLRGCLAVKVMVLSVNFVVISSSNDSSCF